ncbi:protein translocase subunit SecF [Agarivorans sp. 2_MG-2023]|uniref:protein translocase subunit SecF n=1 Tax=Agarivorans sp. 2_MG-2023 TaxID=3062647 RepID=UPI0026E3092C|nr:MULTISPECIES: protein translocase subunit SecF [unclassified Agarivorans]MDO6688082.1 protein translocase subunit SecF [Agarivorans sp. 3_MG-2023]MDO6717677.1 protein translocase subunit SecF [Agarivorans sp. 2_MG-2023]
MSHSLLTRTRLSMSAISLLLFVVATAFIAFKGLNWGLDFTGGVVAEVRLDPHLRASELSPLLNQALQQDVQLISATEPGRWILRYNQVGEHSQSLMLTLGSFSDSVEVLNSSIVGPQVGQDMLEEGGLAILACFVLTMLYLSYRFEWRLALGALVALVHDVVIVLGLFSVTQFEFNLTILAAVLAVLGYSLNDSIIIADRARELFKAKPKGSANELINDALRASFSRTLITSGTTLVTVSSLWLLGGPALEGFAIALCLGIVSGTWSSISLGVTLPQIIGIDPKHYQLAARNPEEALP